MKESYQTRQGALILQTMQNLAGPVTAEALCAILHPHMVCECCGRLFHLDCSQLEALSEHIREHHGFLLDYKNTILYGVCAACAEKEAKS